MFLWLGACFGGKGSICKNLTALSHDNCPPTPSNRMTKHKILIMAYVGPWPPSQIPYASQCYPQSSIVHLAPASSYHLSSNNHICFTELCLVPWHTRSSWPGPAHQPLSIWENPLCASRLNARAPPLWSLYCTPHNGEDPGVAEPTG